SDRLRGTPMKIYVVLVCLTVWGCATTQVKTVQLTSRFDEQEMKARLRPGKARISGNAFVRQNGGGVVTCAGSQVSLIPKTDYSAERIRAIYGNEDSGFYSANDMFWKGGLKFE